ncbi:MAG: hypothetical protein ACR2IQ_02625 [Minisyncoccia bacterium]
MSQSNPITIDNFQAGVGASPYVGFGKMVGLDIFNKPGIIQSGPRLDNTGTTFSGLVTAQAISTNGTLFQGTFDGKLYKNGILLQSGLGSVHDLAIIQDYLIISKNGSTLDLYGPISSGSSYVSNWQTGLENSVYGKKKMVVGKDNVVYIGNETKLASITGFSAGTGTLNTQILLTGIFNDKSVQTICEYNRYIAIMTGSGGSSYGNSTLYFMDRGTVDVSQVTFSVGIGIDIPERNVTQMITNNNKLYFFGGDTGTLYQTNQVTYTAVAMLPNRLALQTYSTYCNAISLVNNQILIGVGGDHNDAFDVVYGIYAFRGNALVCKSLISSGGYGQTNAISIGSIIAGGGVDTYFASWQDGSSVGVDQSSFRLGTNYNVYFESPFYETGTAIKPRTFQTVQFNFANNLVSSQSLRLKYRIASNASWTTFATYSYSGNTLTMTFADGSVSSQTGLFNTFHSKFPVTNTTNMQVRVEYNTGTATYGTNIELQSITLI